MHLSPPGMASAIYEKRCKEAGFSAYFDYCSGPTGSGLPRRASPRS